MRNGQSLDDRQIREVLRTELGTKTSSFGIQAIRRLFATYIIKEKQTNPRNLKSFAHKMGTSVEMLMSNYVQVPDDEDEDSEYTGLGDLFMAEKEKELRDKKRLAQTTDSYRQKKREREQSEEYKQKRKERVSKRKAL